MSNIILLFLCLFLGVFLKRIKLFPENSHIALNAFVINISLSALTLHYIPRIELNSQLFIPVSVAWINIALAVLIFTFLGKRLGWSKTLVGAVIMTAGFGNTSFMGIPVIQALFGESGIQIAMLVDQPGSFVAISTVGIAIASYYSGGQSTIRAIIKKLLRYPPFIAFVVALTLNLLNVGIPNMLDDVFTKLGATTVPLALVSVGSQLKWEHPGKYVKPLSIGLVFKLILIPFVIYSIYFLILKQCGEVVNVSLIESAMPSMITASIIATSHNLEPKLCNMMVGLGIPVSFLTIGFWYWLIM